MTAGDVDITIVEAPLTETRIKTGVEAGITATNVSGAVTISSFNQGRSMCISVIATA